MQVHAGATESKQDLQTTCTINKIRRGDRCLMLLSHDRQASCLPSIDAAKVVTKTVLGTMQFLFMEVCVVRKGCAWHSNKHHGMTQYMVMIYVLQCWCSQHLRVPVCVVEVILVWTGEWEHEWDPLLL